MHRSKAIDNQGKGMQTEKKTKKNEKKIDKQTEDYIMVVYVQEIVIRFI